MTYRELLANTNYTEIYTQAINNSHGLHNKVGKNWYPAMLDNRYALLFEKNPNLLNIVQK